MRTGAVPAFDRDHQGVMPLPDRDNDVVFSQLSRSSVWQLLRCLYERIWIPRERLLYARYQTLECFAGS